ncbi:hypothetical protein A0257_21285 [Hymenobacter psoromatis]|nr:hypothetical protein A0257_21285 [Hymenobacter psoromatis]
MTYNWINPSAQLASLISEFWQLDNPTTEPVAFTVLPDGKCDLVLILSPDLSLQTRLFGVGTAPLSLSLPPHTTWLGVSFLLLAADYLLPGPLPLNGQLDLPADFWDLHTLPAPTLSALAAHLIARFTAHLAGHPPDPRKQQLFQQLYQEAGTQPVAQLAVAAGWAPRQLNRYFRRQFGLSLKTFSNMLRAYTAAQRLGPADLLPLGYYDQSHGIRELKKYLRATPRQLCRDDRFIQLRLAQHPDLCVTQAEQPRHHAQKTNFTLYGQLNYPPTG